jgi:hypothetical protein
MKRLWGIRHVRWLWHAWQLSRWVSNWASVGIGLGRPNKADVEALDQIWRGER